MQTKIVTIKGNLSWVVAQDKSSLFWVAQCPPLKIVAQGETYPQLMEAIADCIQALFSDLLATGELASFLREHQWQALSPLPEKTSSRVRFDIPYDIKQRSAHDFEAVCCQ